MTFKWDFFGFVWIFRCSATNKYFKDDKQIRHSLEVTNSITTNNAKLLSPLQNKELLIPNESDLILHCAPTFTTTSKGNAIRWTFTSRALSSQPTDLPTQNPNQLHLVNMSVDKNDGIYKCYLGDEYQVNKLYIFRNIKKKIF